MNTLPAFLLSAQQPIRLRFEFRRSRARRDFQVGTADAQPAFDGSIQVFLTIDKTTYGPYSTGIFAFHSAWEGRKAKRVSQESQDLSQTLAIYQARIQTVYEALLKTEKLVDGQAVLNALHKPESISKVVTLMEVYDQFINAKKAVIEDDQSKRQVSQIATATFETYAKRWVMIHAYLAHLNRTQIPVKAIEFKFATNLKEWLTTQRKPDGDPYKLATINKAITLLKQLMKYAHSKGCIDHSPVDSFPCRGSSPANPKPLTKQQLDQLESCVLPPGLRLICDSWLVAGELCLHHGDYIQLPKMKFVKHEGMQFIQHARRKQTGSTLTQTVNVTDRAMRLIAKWGGVSALNYQSSAIFSKALKKIVQLADLRDEHGKLIDLQFGQGRDSGLTQRAIDGANGIQLSKMAGWSKPVYAERYIGNPLAIVGEFAKGVQAKSIPDPDPKPDASHPFIAISKAS